jgi:hypothetical protein
LVITGTSPAQRAVRQWLPAVRLDSDVVRRDVHYVGRRLTALDSVGRPIVGRANDQGIPPTWAADSLGDSVRLSFVDGFSGAAFALAARAGQRADTLRGSGGLYSDGGGGVEPYGPVLAVRTAYAAGASGS